LEEVMGSLFKTTAAAGTIGKGEEVWQSAVADWSKKFVVQDILPEVFNRLGVKI
ncbi:unnamed protein product, partial [marine sediment metagenome]